MLNIRIYSSTTLVEVITSTFDGKPNNAQPRMVFNMPSEPCTCIKDQGKKTTAK